MINGANSFHQRLREELENYIKSQYLGKTPILLSALSQKLSDKGVLYQEPYIESSPAYQTVPNGIQKADLPEWLKVFFDQLTAAKLGVFPSPFQHQIQALEAAVAGKDLFVSTGTGSGKTECFMWPLLAKLADEARNHPQSWQQRGVRVMIMYPMNALVSDQVSRLRRLVGDKEGRFINIFRNTCGNTVRRPQFGMYTGRTPYPGKTPTTKEDRSLEKTLKGMCFPKTDSDQAFLKRLTAEGKVPAKSDMNAYLQRLHDGTHTPNPEDAELITRFEMQQFCPDILITNYSMLEYMLLRPREKKIWEDTWKWLNASSENKLLFVIDEAHMYRGSSGGEVALLLRRLFHKLGIGRNRVQFILTTASMPSGTEDECNAVLRFAQDLTAADSNIPFCYLTGSRESISGMQKYDIPFSRFNEVTASELEGTEAERLSALNRFWQGLDCTIPFLNMNEAGYWLYDNIIHYRPFYELISACRGNAKALHELASSIFPHESVEAALNAVSILLAIAPMAHDRNGAILFPARMHMLFRGIRGIYACTNLDCSHSHTEDGMTLGEVFLSDGNLVCPHCQSMVYELYNERRCGALFYKGYILTDDIESRSYAYLWRYPGQFLDYSLKEIHLFIPDQDYVPPKRNSPVKFRPCYLDTKTGFINFRDDADEGKHGIRKLYYSDYTAKGWPEIITFPTCPHCNHQLAKMQLTSFSTRGNQSFFNLIQTQFQLQPPVQGKDHDPDKLPNEGRKVLLFSDSRQRAAKLARDMSSASDITAARQMFVLAVQRMMKTGDFSLEDFYDFVCQIAKEHHITLFNNDDRTQFADHCENASKNYQRSAARGRPYQPRYKMSDAPRSMQKVLLRLFCGGYNTLYDSASCWLEPVENEMYDAVDELNEAGIEVSDEAFKEVFHAWISSVCDGETALGHKIPDEVREEIRPMYYGYGLKKDWDFSQVMKSVMGWEKESKEAEEWKRVLKSHFLDSAVFDPSKLYINISQIRPCADIEQTWYRCERCSEITPYLLKSHCPSCGDTAVHALNEHDLAALEFWRKPIQEAQDGKRIHVIDTEEHTAQLSHKDQRDDLWSQTEKYELRFQDFIQDDETPVDILSSTTTMEVGIDIGSLVAVGLRNIPPMRENYQQRAGRAGRRGASLSTIITFCEDGPHDTLYFKNPVPMFRGDPRKPWIDISSEKLLFRHLTMVILQEFSITKQGSLDSIPAFVFLDSMLVPLQEYLSQYQLPKDALLPQNAEPDMHKFKDSLLQSLNKLAEKRNKHPELFGVPESEDADPSNAKMLLDALYEEGIIPTYSFPKNVVSTYIETPEGKIKYEVERGLDIAISEYAPGRSIVVDKKTYQIGGLFYPGSEKRKGMVQKPAEQFIEDPNYLKRIVNCSKCKWFGLKEDHNDSCPFCGNPDLQEERPMLQPWGFAPKNATDIPEAQLSEEFSFALPPEYSTLPKQEQMEILPDYKNIRLASRQNQRIIMMNRGPDKEGFRVCKECGAAMPGENAEVLKNIERPYKTPFRISRCRHSSSIQVDLGYDFITDMLVLEFAIDSAKIDMNYSNPWKERAAQSLAEALRLAACKLLDIEFTELVSGYRVRMNQNGAFIDVYLYDSLSSGAGYASAAGAHITEILQIAESILLDCDCDTACNHCLKHYRNQFVHSSLDRHAAIQLLKWGKNNELPKPISSEQQIIMMSQLKDILAFYDIQIQALESGLQLIGNGRKRKIVIYPYMTSPLRIPDAIYISDYLAKYAKPYALKKILSSFQ